MDTGKILTDLFGKKQLGKIGGLLKRGGKKILIYHTDPDGICSAAMMLKFFTDFVVIPSDGPLMSEGFLAELIKAKPDLLAVLDIPIDQEWKKVERLQREVPGARLLVIDHHVPEKDLGHGENMHINPRFRHEVYIPASALVYRMLHEMGKDVAGLIWIPAIGIIGDYAFRECKDLLDECISRYPEIGKPYPGSVLDRISHMIMSAVVLHGYRGSGKALEIMVMASEYAEVAENRYLLACDEKVSREISRVIADFGKNSKAHDDLDLFIYSIKSRLNISSTISTMLAERHPDRIIIILKPGEHYVKVSARYQSGKINLNDLMKHSVEGIGSGGGHIKAAGAVVTRKDLPEFERRLKERIRELKGGK